VAAPVWEATPLPPGLLDVAPGPDPVSSYEKGLPMECAGPEVNLRFLPHCRCRVHLPPGQVWHRMKEPCAEGFYGRDLTRYLRATITPEKPRVLPGEVVMLELALENRTNKDLGVMFRTTLRTFRGEGSIPEVIVTDANGDDATFGGNCGTGMSSAYGDYLVLIAPGGKAVLKRPWEAATMVGKDPGDGRGCLFEPAPLAKGTYRLRMSLPFEASQKLAEDVETAEGTIEVGD
jgi:hypothetical protein